MMKTTRFLFAIIASVLMASSAHAGSISFLGGGSWASTQASGGTQQGSGSQLGYGGGLLLNFGLGGPFTLEMGGLYLHHKQAIGSGTMMTNQVQVPVDIRLWGSRILSIGAGGYYGIGMGNLEETDSSGNVTYNGAYSGVRTKNDYGALGSVRIQIPLSEFSNFLLNGNYLYGLRNVNDTGDGSTLKTREFQGMLGLSFDW